MRTRQEQLFRVAVEGQRKWVEWGGQAGGPFRIENATIVSIAIPEAQLSYAHLENVDFHDCDFSKVQFDFATLKNVGFHRCWIPDASFRNITARNLEIRETDARRTSFVDAKISGFHADMDTRLDRSFFIRASMRYAHLSDVSVTHSNFARATLYALDAKNLDASEAFFRDTKLTEARFKGSRLVNATFDFAELSGAEFETCTIDGATFKESEISQIAFVNTDTTKTPSLLEHPEFTKYNVLGVKPAEFKIGL